MITQSRKILGLNMWSRSLHTCKHKTVVNLSNQCLVASDKHGPLCRWLGCVSDKPSLPPFRSSASIDCYNLVKGDCKSSRDCYANHSALTHIALEQAAHTQQYGAQGTAPLRRGHQGNSACHCIPSFTPPPNFVPASCFVIMTNPTDVYTDI